MAATKDMRASMTRKMASLIKPALNEHGKKSLSVGAIFAYLIMALVVFLVLYVLFLAPKSPFNMIFIPSKFQYTQKMELAYDYLYADNYKKAKPLLEDAIKLRPNEPLPHDKLGVAYFKLGQPDRAIFELQKAVKLAPRYDEAYANLAAIYIKFAQENINKGDVQSARNNLLRAEKEVEKALGIKSKKAEYLRMQNDIIAARQKLPQ
jgi:tetratricopeptide (TPR) repeat protein